MNLSSSYLSNTFRIKKLKMLAVIALLLILVLLPPFLPSFYKYLLTMAMIWAIFAMAYDICFGYTGMLSLYHAIFFGFGAYGSALMLIHFNLNFWSSLFFGVCFGAVASLVLGSVILKTKGVHFILSSFIIGIIIFLISLRLNWLTGGEDGISFTKPELPFFGFTFPLSDYIVAYYCALVFFILSYFCLDRLAKSQLGLVFRAVRENENLAESLGYNVGRYKLIAMTVSGLFSSLSGSLYSMTLGYSNALFIHPTQSVQVFVWVLLGGAGTLIGPILGTFALVFFFDWVRSWSPHLHPIFLGILLILGVIRSHKGLIGLIELLQRSISQKLGR